MKKLICVLLIFFNLTFVIPSLSRDLSFAEACPERGRGEYLLSSGDQLDISIIGHKDWNTKQTITPDGQASLPMLGVVSVEGQTLKGFQKYLTDSYSAVINNPKITINLTPKPIYVVQYNLKTDVWEVKTAKSIDEAKAFVGLDPSLSIEHGNVYKVSMGTKPDFWETNWYKIITATAVLVGIYSTISK